MFKHRLFFRQVQIYVTTSVKAQFSLAVSHHMVPSLRSRGRTLQTTWTDSQSLFSQKTGLLLREADGADVQTKLLIGLSDVHGRQVHDGQPGRGAGPVLHHGLAPVCV